MRTLCFPPCIHQVLSESAPYLGQHGTVRSTTETKGLDPGQKGLHFSEVFKAREQMPELWY